MAPLRRRAGALALLALFAGSLAGCGGRSVSSAPVDTSTGTGTISTTSPARSVLAIHLTDPVGGVRLFTLSCNPAGGTHPTPSQACRTLEDTAALTRTTGRATSTCLPLPFREQAVITGTWHGASVTRTYDRSTTCAARTWGRLLSIFAPLNAAGGL